MTQRISTKKLEEVRALQTHPMVDELTDEMLRLRRRNTPKKTE